jgi:hypothetical protein
MQNADPAGETRAHKKNMMERFSLSGAIEAEFGYESTGEEDAGDLVLATVELGADVDIAEHVTGTLLFLYEEDDTEPMDVDEGFITLNGGYALPLFLSAGKMYLPFGNFESHFVSDPLPLELGETNQSAALVGYKNDVVVISAAVFNGDVDEAGDDDTVDSFALGAVFSLPGHTMEGVGLSFGASWISNIGDTDGLEAEIADEALSSHVAGFSAFASVAFLDRVFLEIEYLGAMDDFEAGELSFDGGEAFAPSALNLELAVAVSDAVEMAVRYESGEDMGDFLPEDQYGVVAAYSLFENTCLAVEYQHGEFAAGHEVDVVTAQLAVEF